MQVTSGQRARRVGSTRARGGFTLFEIAISLAILATAIAGAGLLFPVGLRAQQLARFQVYAAVKMIQLAEQYSAQDHQFMRRQIEGEELGRSSFTYGHLTDLEYAETGAHPNSFGIPLPDEIARRLDSDGDEIARLLDDGGHVYYPTPRPAQASFWNQWSDDDMFVASEAQKLVIGIVGYPQQDGLVAHPCISWPYFEFYPAPPVRCGTRWPDIEAWLDNAAPETWSGPGERAPDPVHDPFPRAAWPGRDQAVAVRDAWIARSPAALLTACQDLVAAVGIPTVATPGGPLPQTPSPLPAGTWRPDDQQVFPRPCTVLALRFLAFAAAWTTDPAAAPPATPDQKRYAQDCAEVAMAWARRYASANPYDWGAMRPSQAITAFDFPLLQFDLFPDRLGAPDIAEVDDGGGGIDRSWRVIGPIRPLDIGSSIGFGVAPNHQKILASFGDERHFDLARPFAAAERCREVVFWAVDWQAYVDCESAPSARFDARNHNRDSRGVQVTHQDFAMNPEREYVWSTAARVPIPMEFNGRTALRAGYPTIGSDAIYPDPDWLLGNWGADRNGNGRFDAGPVPGSARMRAQTVARFCCYDQRILTSVKF